ncbi:TrmH family RNA methyltransferase [Winogradskyella maritima]|uniref:TrmH family RNA methyltransferase n=1 Tax=Winogradskyella maritima TaxID=1517766 RepID=A0ABV8AIR8_9FLAO|nr:TrmH family RNA methyltransferase [Winogradskyella maritima]
MQHTHYTSPFTTKQFPIVIVSENVTNAANVGSLFRAADAFGVEKLIFCGEHVSLGKRFTKTSRATEQYVDFALETDAIKVLEDYQSSAYTIIGLEITSTSLSLKDFKLKQHNPIVLLIGDENHGISEQALNLCEYCIHIDMFGNNSSMNVTHATSIALYELTKQLQNKNL